MPLSNLIRDTTLDEEDYGSRAAHGSVLPRESKRARLSIDAKSCDGICELVAHVEEIPSGIEVERARMIAAGPFLAAPMSGFLSR
jgi:hypothetical protein